MEQSNTNSASQSTLDGIYQETEYLEINTGGKTIHAKRIPGRWRTLKWWTSSVWLLFFLGPYLRWNGRQAVLFDIPNRQFHIFGATILPQDFWMLSLVLLFFAILLAMATALAGRVYCGFFCFQTVWTDLFTWLEEKLEGPPQKRRKLDQSPWDLHKLRIKLIKHLIWVAIGLLTGISFVAWFTDAYQFWGDLFRLDLHPAAWVTILLFTLGTYFLAGFLREQACFWLCPYARIQSAMVDKHTLIPAYDAKRGEPRGRLRKGGDTAGLGDCIDCNQCVAVCPTGVDIRHGLQEGCIMCALCIDACDQVMDKIQRPRGLIRYASLDELEGGEVLPLLKRTRIWVYGSILLLAVLGIAWGLSSLDAIQLNVIHERQPLFVVESDGSIQNKYTLKVLNKTMQDIPVTVEVSGPEGAVVHGFRGSATIRRSTTTPLTIFVRVPRRNLRGESEPIRFRVTSTQDPELHAEEESLFLGPGSG
ncbi:MAG TPA: cytochrome c oxidase accessory protein CcoG [Gammaproteobacteria bacterium]|nr:cytochrome c oxidase accessory protein CcoG [Gammaproteobacteria bacterium]